MLTLFLLMGTTTLSGQPAKAADCYLAAVLLAYEVERLVSKLNKP